MTYNVFRGALNPTLLLFLLWWALDRGANSRQLLDRLQYVLALCDPVTLTFDLLTKNHIICWISQGNSIHQV